MYQFQDSFYSILQDVSISENVILTEKVNIIALDVLR